MPDIRFIAGGELEIFAAETWKVTPLFNSDPPATGITGAHGAVYDTTTWPTLKTSFDASPLVTVKTRFFFENSVDNEPFMQLHDGISTHLSMIYRSTGAIEIKCGSDLLATSATGLFNVNTWYELEWRARISNGAGMIAVNRNGSQIICVPGGADTYGSGAASVDGWSMGSDELGAYFDDCVVDRSGAYLGTGEVETLMPNGVGDLSQLTPDSIAANFSRVNDAPHDSNTSYVFSTGDQIDTYQFEDRTIAGTPLAVMLSVCARHTAGSPTFKLVCRIDGENFETEAFNTSINYQGMFYHCWTVNPATGEAWTDETIDAAQWGVHCLATGIRVTQVGLLVYVKQGESDECLAAGNRNYCLSVDNDFN